MKTCNYITNITTALKILFLFGWNYVSAQPEMKVHFDVLGVENGLSQSVVYDVIQDKKGFIWITTMNGLNRYDGYSFTVFRHDENDSFSIASSRTRSLFEDSKERLWVGCFDKGLVYFDRTHRSFYNILPGAGEIFKIREDSYGNLWICNDKNITCIYSFAESLNTNGTLNFKLRTTSINLPDSLSNAYYTSIFSDFDKEIYATNHTALYKLKFDSSLKKIVFKKLFTYRFSIPSAWFMSDKNTRKWYLIENDELLESSDAGFITAKKILNILMQNAFIDKQSRLWYSKDNDPGYLFNLKNHTQKKIIPFDRSDKKLPVGFTALLQDAGGTIWLNTYNIGLATYNDDANRFHSELNGNYISSLKEINKNEANVCDQWILTFKDSALRIEKTSRGFNKDVRDKDGMFWYPADKKLVCYNPSTNTEKSFKIPCKELFQQFYSDKNLPVSDWNPPDTTLPNIPQCLAIDKHNCIWMYFYNVLLSYDIDKNRYETVQSKYSNNIWQTTIRTLYVDGSNTIWAALNNGIYSYNKYTGNESFYAHKIGDSESIADYMVNCFCDDPPEPEKYIWIGTGNGLSRMEKATGKCKNLTIKNSLPSNVIFSIQNDGFGNLWMGTNNGLCCLHAADLSISNYNVDDGLPGSEFNRSASVHLNNGIFVFGGMKGITWFNPKDIQPLSKPSCILTDLKIFGKSINVGEENALLKTDINCCKNVSIPFKDNVVTFSFAGIDYSKINGLSYRYRLTGFDKDWIYNGNTHEATYTNLNPGNYTFAVEASNTNNVWGKESEPLHLYIIPAWWQTVWFKIIALIIIAGLVYIIYRYQLRKALEVEKIRSGIARDLHDEIGSTMSAITLFSDMAYRQSQSAVVSPQLLQKINATSQEVIQTMRDIVWSISNKNDSFDEMITQMHAQALELLEMKNCELHFTADEKLNSINLRLEKRQNLYLIYKEALNNIIKYAEAKNVWIRIFKEKNQIILFVKDDGKGFDTNENYSGNGLVNMKRRAAYIGAAINIISVENSGSEITVTLPV